MEDKVRSQQAEAKKNLWNAATGLHPIRMKLLYAKHSELQVHIIHTDRLRTFNTSSTAGDDVQGKLH
jgi:hypothetical protein